MTLLQAMERTDWSLRVESVCRRDDNIGYLLYRAAQMPTPQPEPCEVCDDEFCRGHFVVVRDGADRIYVDVGPRCASDIESGIKSAKAAR